MKDKKMMYLSLPITGRNIERVKEDAEKIKRLFEGKGFTVVTTFDVTEEGMSYNCCMGRDIEALLGCDGIILCHDWFGSRGCRAECSVAQVYGKTIKIDNTKYEED